MYGAGLIIGCLVMLYGIVELAKKIESKGDILALTLMVVVICIAASELI